MEDIKSVFWANKSVKTAALPSLGSAPPILNRSNGEEIKLDNTVIAFVRHCGCPFAEAEVRNLAKLSAENPKLFVVINCMGDEALAKDWFSRIGGNEFKDPSRVEVVSDYDRKNYANWGVGIMSFGQLFSMPMMTALSELKGKGIVNTATGAGSNRWQNSGGFGINSKNEITFIKLAVHAGDMVDYDACVASLML